MRGALSPEKIRRIDSSGMLGLMLGLPGQVGAGYGLARPRLDMPAPESVVVLGMGGSAISGDLLSSILAEKGGPPVQVVRDYHLPARIGPGTLVFAVSYSGNTGETLSACEEAKRRGLPVVTIASGGALGRERAGGRLVRLPPGYQPRAALALMLLPMMGVLEDLGVADFGSDVDEAGRVLEGMRGRLSPVTPAPANVAKAVAEAFLGSFPTVLSGPRLAPAARRWRTQLNENAKVLSREDTLPEMDHNDLAAWAGDPMASDCAVVLLRDRKEDPAMARRIALTRRLGLDRAGSVRELRARGRGALARLLSCVFVGDLASLYLAVLRGVDPTPVDVIGRLKREMAGGWH